MFEYSFLYEHLRQPYCFCFIDHPIQVQELSSPPRASAVVKDCIKNCVRHTYNFLFANCDDVYKRESKQQPNMPTTTNIENSHEQNEELLTVSSSSSTVATTTTTSPGPNLRSLQFWHQLMYLLTCIISEDRERYSLVLSQLVLMKRINRNYYFINCFLLIYIDFHRK